MTRFEKKKAKLQLHWSWESFALFWLFVFIIIVFGPLLALLADAAHYVLMGSSDWLSLVIPSGRRLELFAHSLMLAATVALTGMGLGTLAGSLLWRWRTGFRTHLRWVLLMLAPLPPYVTALAWSSTVSGLSPVFESVGLPGVALTGWVGSWWVQTMAFLPICVGLALLGLESIELPMIEAARLLRSDAEVFAKVILPLAAPAIMAGIGFLFVLSLADYSVPSLFSVSVYALEIFAEYSASNQTSHAFLLALPVLIVTMLVVVYSQSALRNAAQSPAWHGRTSFLAPKWPVWFLWLQRIALAVYLGQSGVILISLVYAVGTWGNMTFAVTSASSEIQFTFWIALAAALFSIPLALATARELVRFDIRGWVWWLLVTSPLAIPAPLIGIGLISIWNRPYLPNLYGTVLMPVLAALARFVPLAALVMLAQLRHADPLLIDAARVFEANALQRWLRIQLPLLAPGLLAAAAVVFALSAGELGATLIVVPPGQGTLTIRIYNYLHYGASSVVAGLCLMMAVATVAAGCVAILALLGWSQVERRSSRDD